MSFRQTSGATKGLSTVPYIAKSDSTGWRCLQREECTNEERDT